MHNENGLTIIEINMIKNHQIKPNERTIYYFYNKYKETLTHYLFNKVSKSFKHIIIEKNDLISIIWSSTKIALSLVKIDQLQCQLSTVIYHIAKRQLIRWERHLNTLPNKILNEAVSIDKDQNFNIPELGFEEHLQRNTKIDLEIFMKKFLKDKSKKQQDFIKKIICLKSYGYTYRQIAQKMNTSLRKVFYVITKLQEEGEKFF